MDITTRRVKDVLLVQITGRIDFSNTTDFENRLLGTVADSTRGRGKTVLDLGGVTYMSSSGLRVLMMACKDTKSRGGVIVVASLQPMLREIFKISRFDVIFPVYENVEEALEALSPGDAPNGTAP